MRSMVLHGLWTVLVVFVFAACGGGGSTTGTEDTQDNQDVTIEDDQTNIEDTSEGDEKELPCVDEDDDGFFVGDGCMEGLVRDCDDGNPNIHPSATEVCGNDVDENCDGKKDECGDLCVDSDADGFVGKTDDCPEGVDCDDNNNQINPDATEVCGNSIDEDCDGYDDSCDPCADVDEDGYVGASDECPEGTDCDDKNNQIYPGAVEVCGIQIDENCYALDAECPPECVDQDNDGYGFGADCDGYDCNDGNAHVHPGANEICGNGIDDDCVDGDEVCPTACTDGDSDGFGRGTDCAVEDCDDTNQNIYPGATEICGNGVDEDCNGSDLACDECIDLDGDGYGEGTACDGADCDDTNPAIHPGANEICGNGIDEDCTGDDSDCDCVDLDGDGYGAGTECMGADCDDTDGSVHPGATEICGNGVDDDCVGGDETCQTVACTSDANCGNDQLCDQGTGNCRFAKVWEWWAPTFYVDTDTDGPGLDLPRSMNFDGDWNAANNEVNLPYGSAEAVVYYSFVKTSTHWYLGYYLFFPKRWTTWFGGTKYENTVRSVMMVVKQDGTMYGKPVLMETTTEDTYLKYTPTGETTELAGTASIDGEFWYDTAFATNHHPIVYVKPQNHGIWADEDFWADIDYWEIDGFPDGDGVVYRFGGTSETPMNDNDDVWFDTVSIHENIWTKRNDIGETELFDEFGHFNYANNTNDKSVAPWRLYDSNLPLQPHGEWLYNPADLVRRHFSDGWGSFSFTYVYNPYVVKVLLWDLGVYVTADPLDGPADPYVKLWMYDGEGTAHTVLNNFYGIQASWYKDAVEVGTILDMWMELAGRNYFYGFMHPDHDYFGIEVRDYDGGWSGDEWLMDPEEAQYFSFDGIQLLDFADSDVTVEVVIP